MPWFRRPEMLAALRCLVLAAPGCVGSKAWTQGLADGAIRVASAPASTVTATAVETGDLFSCKTERAAQCSLLHLPPGQYRIFINGFAANLVEVLPGVVTEVRAHSASATDAGLLPVTEPEADDDGLLSARGLSPDATRAALDGASATQALEEVQAGKGSDRTLDPDDDADSAEATTGPSHGLGRGRHAGVAYPFAEGSVREFRLGTGQYSAQAGGAGGVLTSVSRGGGEKLHGSGFFNLRSDLLAAKNPLAIATSYADGAVTSGIVKPHDLRENFGGTLGGPVPRFHGLRYFAAVDLQRRGFPAISSPQDPQFYNLTATQRALLGTRGVPGKGINSALNYLSSLTGSTPRRADQDIEFARLDWHVRSRLTLGAEYNRLRWNAPAGLIDAPVVARGRASLGNAAGSVDQVLLRLSPHWSSRTTNQTRLAFIRDLQYESPQSPLAQEQAIGPGGSSPEVNIGPNGLLFGTPATLSKLAYPDEQRLEANDVVTLERGRHLLEFGATVSSIREDVATLGNAAGSFHYDSGETKGYAGGLVDWITDYVFNAGTLPNGGCPRINAATHLFCFRSFTQSFGETHAAFSTMSLAGFLEDTWHPARRLTLHAGMRYEYTRLPLPLRPNPALDAIFGAQAATSFFPEDRNNLGPRFSAAFEPFGAGHGVVKLGYGIFFGQLPGATMLAALTETGLPSATTKIRLRPSAVVACPQQPANGFGYLCSLTAQPASVAELATSAIVFDRRFRLPVVQQASLSFEQAVGRRTTLAFGFVVNEDRQLPTSTDLNIAPSTETRLYQLQGGTGATGVRDGETFTLPFYTARVTPEFGPVTEITSHVNATYNGLLVRVATRPVSGVLIAANYTWSKAVDYGQAGSATPRTNGQLDPFHDGYDKGLSALNYPEALHATATWTPKNEGSGVRKGLNGWSLAVLTTARSGRPYSYDLSGGSYLPGGHQSLNGSGGALYLPTVGRNTLRLPPTIKTDLRLARGFRLGKVARGEATVEAFNLFNHQSIVSVNQRAFLVGTPVSGVTPLVFQSAAAIASEGLNTTPFGTPTGSGGSLNRERQVQLSLRIAF